MLIVIVLIAPAVYFYLQPVTSAFSGNEYAAEVEAFIAEYNEQHIKADTATDEQFTYNPFDNIASFSAKTKAEKAVTYFDFDPNTIGEKEWQLLGFSQKQAKLIETYKAKGGKFYKPEDVRKLYVVSDEKYNELLPYIKIEITAPPKEYRSNYNIPAEKKTYTVDINTADSALFERLRGIGPSLARRIVNYRTRLGGFVSVEQVSEVWGLPDSTYQSLKDRFVCSPTEIAKINVNTADIETMRKHPYINYPLAKIIYNYRSQHGNYESIDDLRKLATVTDSSFAKLAPYLSTE
ncbi:MAG: helix-hairpin-helix domain-containing protein [Chitinophagales bacterium]|nr:helix-hairpin-helix domain-containing protein [Chitinophagales bacterium]